MTYFEAAKEIANLDRNNPDFENLCACIVKKAMHQAKFETYHKLFLYIKYEPKKPKAFKKSIKKYFADFLKVKMQTHEDFKNLSERKQIYGLFDWKKPERTDAIISEVSDE